MSRSEKNKMNNNRNRMRVENDRHEVREILNGVRSVDEIDDELNELAEVRKVSKTRMSPEKDRGPQKPRWERVDKRTFENDDNEQERGE